MLNDRTSRAVLLARFHQKGASFIGPLLVGVALGICAILAFNHTMHVTSTDEFCVSCHEQRDNSLVMLRETIHFRNASGHHAGCSDCHVPREFFPKLVRKVEAAREVWGHFTGVIDTPEKYAAHAPVMKAREIARIRANDSRECRNCHDADAMLPALQSQQARHFHRVMQDSGQTCIDCHAGLAHDPSSMPGAKPTTVEVLADHHGTSGQCVICHAGEDGAPNDDNLSIENSSCVDCHGDLEALAATVPPERVTPHRSHFIGDVACTTCHAGHQKSVTYCDACHSFDFDIPYGGQWQREIAPLVADAHDRQAQQDALAAAPRDVTDVVVIGSGGAGMSAAVAARDVGARVILLEKEPVPGGNTKLAAGGMNAAGTRAQAALGIHDSVASMIDDTIKGAYGTNDPALVQVLAEHSAASIDWLVGLGADMSDVGRMGGASVDRSHRPAGGAGVGAHVAQVLWDAIVDRNVDVRFNSRAVRLVKNREGAVSGVLVKGKFSGYYVIQANAVVLATGGFSHNNTMVAQYAPQLAGFSNTNQPGASGDGLEIAEAAGAATLDMKYIQSHPTYSPQGGVLVTEAIRGNGAILVNRDGKRFVNELTTRDKASTAILAQAGGSAFLVFDEAVRRSLSKIESFIHLGIVERGATPSALAASINVPPEVLSRTIADYGDMVKSGHDSDFARPDLPRALTESPYYAVEVKPAVHHTMGGVRIDLTTQVLDENGAPINGLYAAGEATGGIHGANRLGANAVSDIITFGRLAGERAGRR